MLSDRQKMINGLRHIADALENNPLLPVPYFGAGVTSVDGLAEMMAAGRAYGGFWKKETAGDEFQLRRQYASGLDLLIFTARENVCTRIVVGTKVVPASTLPARDEVHLPERVEEIVEWHCPPSLSELQQETPMLMEGAQ